MRPTLHFLFLVFLTALYSCNKENAQPSIPSTAGVYICNEGTFNFGNAEVSFYNPVEQNISNGLFRAANHYSLGDVAQSFYIRDSLGFIVVNNSQKIEVVQLPSFQKIRTITIPGSSPRYFHALNDSIAYVTELYAAKIYVIHYQKGTVLTEITPVSRWTERILPFGNEVLVEERNLDAYPASTAGFVIINPANHSIIQRYTFNGSNINGLVKDKNHHVWLLMAEDTFTNTTASLIQLNNDLSINQTFQFAIGQSPSMLRINGTGDEIYFVNHGVYRMPIGATDLPDIPLFANNNRNIYGLDIDPQSGDIYLSDALDFVQSSRIYRYDKNGTLIHSFTAGVISGNFTFRKE